MVSSIFDVALQPPPQHKSSRRHSLIHSNLLLSFAGQESVWNASADAERQSGRVVRVTPANNPAAQQVDLGTDQRNAAVRDDHRQKQGSVPATVDDVSILLNYWEAP